jgi:hypothetical protein
MAREAMGLAAGEGTRLVPPRGENSNPRLPPTPAFVGSDRPAHLRADFRRIGNASCGASGEERERKVRRPERRFVAGTYGVHSVEEKDLVRRV